MRIRLNPVRLRVGVRNCDSSRPAEGRKDLRERYPRAKKNACCHHPGAPDSSAAMHRNDLTAFNFRHQGHHQLIERAVGSGHTAVRNREGDKLDSETTVRISALCHDEISSSNQSPARGRGMMAREMLSNSRTG